MNRQAAIGAIAASILVLGANANAFNGGPAPRPATQNSTQIASIVMRFCGGAPKAGTYAALEVCGERAMGGALDIFGELAAQLRRL